MYPLNLQMEEKFGFGGEIGISTNKLPPQGPVGINQLTSSVFSFWKVISQRKVIRPNKSIGLLGGFRPSSQRHLSISKIALKKIKLKIFLVSNKKNPFKKKPFTHYL